jgi:sporulation protein YlmC with PRC-barrel domain
MKFEPGMKVISSDGKDVGEIERVVIDPVTKSVSHVVIEKGLLFPDDRVLPVNLIQETQGKEATLRIEAEKLGDLPKFEVTEYVRLNDEEQEQLPNPGVVPFYPMAPVPLWRPGLTMTLESGEPLIEETERNIPTGEVALKEGADILDLDGKKVGEVDELLTNPESDQITDVIVSRGTILKEEKRIPITWVSHMDEKAIHLAVGPKILENLPTWKE